MIKLTDILNEDCWKDYKQVGLKKKNGKMVPNCVPESVVKEEETITEIGIFPIRNYLKGIIPSKMWNTTTPQNKEKLKSTIDDLIRTLNQFWKQHNIPFRVREGKSQNEDLRKWFGKGKTGSTKGGGWDRYSSTGKKLGKCGDGDKGDAYAACLSKEKANKLGPKGRASFVNRKRTDQKKAGDSKKGGNSTKGKTPTFSKTGA